MAAEINVKDLLEAGAHFGHQTRRWNPKMRPFIYTQRDGIHIIDLQQTVDQAAKAYKFLADTVALGSTVLFVGTKKQAKDTMNEEAQRSGQYYVTNRWLGGMLTNFKTIRASIDRLNSMEERREKGEFEKLPKKERLRIDREIDKLEYSLGGIKRMSKLPGAVFLIDPNAEDIALKEANKLGIPVIGVVDTNCNPEGVDYLIAANDDAIRSIQYFAQLMADACLEGSERREIALREQKDRAEKEKAEEKPKAARAREQKVGGKGKAWVARRREDAEKPEEKDVEKYASAKAAEEKTAEKTEEKTEKEESK
jgi:small subunit ribosomal protein S2